MPKLTDRPEPRKGTRENPIRQADLPITVSAGEVWVEVTYLTTPVSLTLASDMTIRSLHA